MAKRVAPWAAAAAALLMVQAEARASTPPPQPTCSLQFNSTVAQSGVAIARGDFGAPLADVFEAVESVEATWEDGTVVAGQLALERFAYRDSVFVWRPDHPLDRTGPLTLDIAIAGTPACNRAPHVAVVEVVDDPSVPFAAPERVVAGIVATRDIVCCDGALPTIPLVSGSTRAGEIAWDEGYCLSRYSLDDGTAQLLVPPDAPALDPVHVDQWIVRVFDGEDLRVSGFAHDDVEFIYDNPLQARIEYVHLGTGQVIEGAALDIPGDTAIHGADDPHDAWDTLEQECSGAPYRCMLHGDGDVGQWVEPSEGPCPEVDLETLLEDTATPGRADAEHGAVLNCAVGPGDRAGAWMFVLGVLLVFGRRVGSMDA